MTLFLDGLFLLLVLYVITQVFLPLIFPSELERNWLFKKKNKHETVLSNLKETKRELSDVVDSVATEADKKLKESKELKQAIKKP